MNAVKILTIRFSNKLSPHEVPMLRGAIIGALEHKPMLFHNHTDTSFRYRYPLIQYKLLHGKAALVCINEGAEQVGEFFIGGQSSLLLGNRTVELQVDRVLPHRHYVQVWDKMFQYRLTRWLPLNQKNYAQFSSLVSLSERVAMLEKLMTGNILSMATGMGIHLEREVACSITKLQGPYPISIKHVKMLAFDADFTCNVSIPNHVGLGKHASLNCGIVSELRPRATKPTIQEQII